LLQTNVTNLSAVKSVESVSAGCHI